MGVLLREQVLERAVEITYEPSQYIIKQGETGSQFFIVKEGAQTPPAPRRTACRCSRSPSHRPRASPARASRRAAGAPAARAGEVECHVDGKLVKLVGTGEYFGERALLKDEPRAAENRPKCKKTMLYLVLIGWLSVPNGLQWCLWYL